MKFICRKALFVLTLLFKSILIANFCIVTSLSPAYVLETDCNSLLYTRRRIARLDELVQTFVVRLDMRLKYKDGNRTHYPSR